MAVGDPYVTAQELKDSISREDTAADTDIERAVEAASRAIEEVTRRRTFWKSAGDETRKYTANSCQLVVVDDLVTLTTLTSDGTAVDTADLVVEPLNAEDDGRPHTRIEVPDGLLSTKRGKIEVTGIWGWPDVPPQVKQMVTILASKLVKRTREATFGVVSAGGLDGDAIRLAKEDPDLQLLVTPLRRNFPTVA